MPDTPRIRVVVADDHPIVIEGVRRYLESEPLLEVVACTSSVDALMRTLSAKKHVDLVVLDVQMPGMRGAPTIEALRAQGPNVVLFTHQAPDDYVAHMIRAGVAGYVSKAAPVDDLMKAIFAVHGGGRWVHDELAALVDRLSKNPPAIELLTEREREVFDLLALGKTPKEIGSDLELAPSTVYAHIERVRHKLGAASQLDIVRYADRWRVR